MENNQRTTDSILEAIESASRNREVWDALTYLEAATSLNALAIINEKLDQLLAKPKF